MVKFLVTGSNGFIGSHIVEYLNQEVKNGQDYQLTGLDLHEEAFPYEKGILNDIRGDVRDEKLVNQLVSEADLVIHMAGFLGTSETIDEMKEAASTNVLGTLNVLDACVKQNKRCVYITIGNDWLNPYSVTKNCAKDLAFILNQYRNGNIVVVRGLNAYGDRQKAYPIRKVFPTFCLQALKGDSIEIYDQGQQIIDLVHVRDLARGLVLAALAPDGVALYQHVLDLGTSVKTTVNVLAELILKEIHGNEVDWKSHIKYLPLREGEPKDSITLGLIEKSIDLINYKPEIDLQEGLKESVLWYQTHLSDFDQKEYEKYLLSK